jgi:hypothetical protein
MLITGNAERTPMTSPPSSAGCSFDARILTSRGADGNPWRPAALALG